MIEVSSNEDLIFQRITANLTESYESIEIQRKWLDQSESILRAIAKFLEQYVEYFDICICNFDTLLFRIYIENQSKEKRIRIECIYENANDCILIWVKYSTLKLFKSFDERLLNELKEIITKWN